MEPLVLYTNPMSRGRTAHWMLEETGLPYQVVNVSWGEGNKSPEFLAINPMGKVPTLKHGETVVTESAAILMYLADLVPEKQLAPTPGSTARGAYYRWILFMAGPFEAFLTARHAGALGDPGSAGYGTEASLFAALDSALDEAARNGMHLAGTHFTAADLCMAAYLNFYMQFKMLPDTPHYREFVARHMTRPACLAAAARDDAAMSAQ